MSFFELVASVVDTLAWPAAVTVSVVSIAETVELLRDRDGEPFRFGRRRQGGP